LYQFGEKPSKNKFARAHTSIGYKRLPSRLHQNISLHSKFHNIWPRGTKIRACKSYWKRRKDRWL